MHLLSGCGPVLHRGRHYVVVSPWTGYVIWAFVGGVSLVVVAGSLTHVALHARTRDAVVVVIIAASLVCPRKGSFLAFVGKISLTYASRSISLTTAKPSDSSIVRSRFNMAIYSTHSPDKDFALRW